MNAYNLAIALSVMGHKESEEMEQYKVVGLTHEGKEVEYTFTAANDDAAWNSEMKSGVYFLRMSKRDGEDWTEMHLDRDKLKASLGMLMEGIVSNGQQ